MKVCLERQSALKFANYISSDRRTVLSGSTTPFFGFFVGFLAFYGVAGFHPEPLSANTNTDG